MSFNTVNTPISMSKILCILDGFGLAPKSPNNAAALAKMPNFKYLLKNYFWTTLKADGENVGQEAGLVGNSEVGHMNIGGLKLVPQLSYQITKSAKNAYDLDKNITPDQLFDPKKFLTTKFEGKNKTIHLIGLFSTGTIHSDLRHWAGAIEAACMAGSENIVMHLISDGRDSDRQSLVATWDFFVKEFEAKIKPFEAKIFLGSLGGRFYSLDRDNNWDRVVRGIFPMLSYKGLDHQDTGSRSKLKQFLISKYNVDLDKILELEKEKFEKDNKHVETEEDFQEYGYKNFHVMVQQHFFFLNENKQDREKLGPLKTDIRWMIEL